MRVKIQIEAVTLVCAACNESIVQPSNGSEFWTIDELDLVDWRVRCHECNSVGKVRKLSTASAETRMTRRTV